MKVKLIRQQRTDVTAYASSGETLVLAVPNEMSIEEIELVLENCLNSLKDEKACLLRGEKDARQTKDEGIHFFGKKLKFSFVDVQSIDMVEGFLLLPKNFQRNEELFSKSIKQYILKIANDILPQMVSTIGERMGKCPRKIKVSYVKDKWGKCNEKKEITLNPKLIMLPLHLIEFVVVYEFLSLCIAVGSIEFKLAMRDIYLNCDDLQNELKSAKYLLDYWEK